MQSTTPLIRLIIQQSNCFAIVERGKAFASMERERELMNKGEIRKGSNMQKGQMVVADYTINPSITFSERGTGGGSLGIGGIFGVVAGIAGSMKSNEATTMLILIDNRSGIQLAAAEGSAKNWDFGTVGGLFGGAVGAGASGFSKTPQGKVLTAAFMDSYNGIVRAVKDYKAQSVEGGMGTGGNLKTN